MCQLLSLNFYSQARVLVSQFTWRARGGRGVEPALSGGSPAGATSSYTHSLKRCPRGGWELWLRPPGEVKVGVDMTSIIKAAQQGGPALQIPPHGVKEGASEPYGIRAERTVPAI